MPVHWLYWHWDKKVKQLWTTLSQHNITIYTVCVVVVEINKYFSNLFYSINPVKIIHSLVVKDKKNIPITQRRSKESCVKLYTVQFVGGSGRVAGNIV